MKSSGKTGRILYNLSYHQHFFKGISCVHLIRHPQCSNVSETRDLRAGFLRTFLTSCRRFLEEKYETLNEEDSDDERPRQKDSSDRTGHRKDEPRSTGGAVVRRGHLFTEVPQELRNKKSFETAIGMFLFRNVQRRGHVEFIYSAMSYMEEFGVHKDLDTYKALLNIFPKGKMVAENMWQLDMWHYPKHQYCAIDLLDQMEYYSVYPDKEISDIVVNAFGSWSYVGRKMKRMMYWMPKFKNMNPYVIPRPTPTDNLELAKLAVKLMCRDPANIISIWMMQELRESKEETWIVSGQCPLQKEHISKHNVSLPLYVDGPFRVWVREQQVNYFVLLADDAPKNFADQFEDLEAETEHYWKSWRRELKSEYPGWRKALWSNPSMHEQSDGTILAICATGSSSKDSLAAWIKFLQRENRKLGEINVLFRLKHAGAEVLTLEELRRVQGQKKSIATTK